MTEEKPEAEQGRLPAPAPPRAEGRVAALLRGAAGVIGSLGLASLVADWLAPGSGVHGFWISAPAILLAPAFAVLAGHGLRRLRDPRPLLVAASALALACAVDTATFYRVLAAGAISTAAVLPASLFLALGFWLLALGATRARPGPEREQEAPLVPSRLSAFCGALATGIALPLLLVLTFGCTSYARPADCAVVLGARVYDDGTPSLALADRTDEGIRLYHAGLVNTLVMSGGVDPHNNHSEARVMRARAIEQGVPARAILLDEHGRNTAATVRNTTALMRAHGLRSVLTVSHGYHQPRLKLLFERAGVRTYTVPAPETRAMPKLPYFVARELAAFYVAALRDRPGTLRDEG